MKTNKKDKTASKSKKNKPEDKEVEKNSSENEIQKKIRTLKRNIFDYTLNMKITEREQQRRKLISLLMLVKMQLRSFFPF